MKGGIIKTLIIVSIVVLLSAFSLVLSWEEKLAVDFLDVGEGDAILIESPFGQKILIDGGDGELILGSIQKELDPWDRVIDLVILSHPHADHLTGLIDVLKNYQVNKFIHFGSSGEIPEYQALLAELELQKIETVLVRKKQRIILGNSCYLDILPPPQDLAGMNLNNQSLISRLDCENKTFLFSGDAEKELEEYLLGSGLVLKSQILKVGHHGSDTSSTETFLKAVDPEIAIISVGQENDYNHPSNIVLYRLKKMGIKTMRTDLLGNIGL